MADDLKRLVAARGQLKGAITRMISFKNTIESSTAGVDPVLAEQKKDRLLKVFEEYNQTNLEILILKPDDDERVEEVEEKFDDLVTFFNRIIQNASGSFATAHTSPHNAATNNETLFRLPPIQLKVFAGEVGTYQSFMSLFTSVIDNDKRLKPCEKLYYLKSYLEGEALSLVNYLPLTDDSYSLAVELLKQRYDNKKQLVNHHVVSVLDLPVIQKATAASFRNLVSVTRQHMGALLNLGAPTMYWDLIMVAILQRKIDNYTLRAYHLENQASNELPKLSEFLTFLEQRAAALEAMLPSMGQGGWRASLVTTKSKPPKPVKCKYCQYVHKLHQCSSFKLADVQKRKQFVTDNKLCNICLNEHSGKQCIFTFKCSVCKGKHNSLLHEDVPQQYATVSQPEPIQDSSERISLLTNSNDHVLLPTIKAKLYDKNGQPIFVRCLLDSASQVSFVLSEVAEQLGCKLQPNKSLITGVCDGTNVTTHQATLDVHASATNFNVPVTCHIVKNITANLPQFTVRNEKLDIPSHIKLADDNFSVCDKIGMLLGADIFFKVLLREQLPLLPSELVLQNTCFGYIVAGKVCHSGPTTSSLASNLCCQQQIQDDGIGRLDETIFQFSQTDTVPETFEGNSEQKLAEKIFQETVVLKDNKFEVALLLKQSIADLHLGCSLKNALKRYIII